MIISLTNAQFQSYHLYLNICLDEYLIVLLARWFLPEDHDAFRPIVGAAGSNLLDIYYAFEDGGDKEQRDAIRRMIPLNNWFVWDRAFKKVYNGVLEDQINFQ